MEAPSAWRTCQCCFTEVHSAQKTKMPRQLVMERLKWDAGMANGINTVLLQICRNLSLSFQGEEKNGNCIALMKGTILTWSYGCKRMKNGKRNSEVFLAVDFMNYLTSSQSDKPDLKSVLTQISLNPRAYLWAEVLLKGNYSSISLQLHALSFQASPPLCVSALAGLRPL